MKKQFFCEHCNKPVPKEADICPHCGSSFKAVKCPKCGFTGKADMFVSGCPICGFLGDDIRGISRARSAGYTRGMPLAASGSTRDANIPAKKDKRKKALPDWFYPVAGIILLGIIALLVIMYVRL